MGWFGNLIKPKIKSEEVKENVNSFPDDLWVLCPSCSQMIYKKEWEVSLHVCQHCGFHDRIGAKYRIEITADDEPNWIKLFTAVDDPLSFNGSIPYKNKLQQDREKTNLEDAVLAAQIKINTEEAIVFAMDFNFMGGSMGRTVGSAFCKCANLAIEKKLPLIV